MVVVRRPVMDNFHLFELINAVPKPGPWKLGLALALGQWLIYLVPAGMVVAWIRGDHASRRELMEMILAALLALGIAEVVAHGFPQPRPFALHLGTQLLAHAKDPGLPSRHVTVFWSLAFATLATRRFAPWSFGLFAAGLAAGWSRVFLGVHFPYDILAAFPVGLGGVVAARALRAATMPLLARILHVHDHLARFLRERRAAARKT